jgi:serine/threonine protein kinase
MGEIFLAEDVKLKRKVAIKKIPSQNVYGNSSKARFLREAQTASQLQHPNICTIYEVYEEEENDYIVMQYIDGVTLDRIIELKSLGIEKILSIAIQVCSGMIEAHAKGIIHRDLKPGNIMVDRGGHVKILDFGLAKVKGDVELQQNGLEDTNITAQGFVIGTISYMSPEQARGESLDSRSDIFSLGSVLYELLEGADPFHDSEQIGILYNILNKEPTFARPLPRELEAIIEKMLAKKLDERFENFVQLKYALEDFQYRYLGSGARENIDSGELNEFIQQQTILKTIKGASDEENFGDIVSQIKRMKTTTRSWHRFPRVKLYLIGVAIVAFLSMLYFWAPPLFQPSATKIVAPSHDFYILLRTFENKTDTEDLAPQVSYLVAQSLNQFSEFKIVGANDLRHFSSLEKAAEEFNIKYELSGTITRIKEIVNIDASLKRFDDPTQRYSITVPGLGGLDSLLVHQIDTLSKQVYQKLDIINPAGRDFIKMSRIFGTSWEAYKNYIEGLVLWNGMRASEAAHKLKLAEGVLAAHYILADLYIYVGLQEQARENLDICLRRMDDLTRSFQLKVKAMDAHQRFDGPGELEYLKRLVDEFPFSKRVYFGLGEALFNQGNVEAAIPHFEKALLLDPTFTRAMNRLGYCYSHAGRHRKALEYFEMYRRHDNSPNSFDSLGDGYFYSGDLISSEACKKMAYTMEENMVFWCYRTLVNISVLKAEFQKAEDLVDNYRKFRDTDDLNADMLATKAFIYFQDRKFLKALVAVDQAIALYDESEISSNAPRFHWLRGLILLALDKTQECKSELYWLLNFKQRHNLSIEKFSPSYKFYVHLGALVLESEQEIQKADEAFRFLLDLKARLSYRTTYFYYQFFHTEYARFLMRNQLYWRALEEIDKCLEFNRNYIPAIWVKAELVERTKPLDARALYRRISDLYGHSAEDNHLRRLLRCKLASEIVSKASHR